MLLRRREIGKQGILPMGYKQVEYIETTGDESYIITSIVPPASPKYDFEQQTMFLDSCGTTMWLFNIKNSESRLYSCYINLNNVFGFGYSSFYNDGSGTRANFNQIYNIKSHLWKGNQTQIINDNITTYSKTETSNLSISAPIGLFGQTTQRSGTPNYSVSHFTKMRYYYGKIWDNNTLILDFIPCINRQKQVGMYDLVTKQFFGNSGTGTFVAGPKV